MENTSELLKRHQINSVAEQSDQFEKATEVARKWLKENNDGRFPDPMFVQVDADKKVSLNKDLILPTNGKYIQFKNFLASYCEENKTKESGTESFTWIGLLRYVGPDTGIDNVLIGYAELLPEHQELTKKTHVFSCCNGGSYNRARKTG